MTTKASFTIERESDTEKESHRVRFAKDGRTLRMTYDSEHKMKGASPVFSTVTLHLNDHEALRDLRAILTDIFEGSTV